MMQQTTVRVLRERKMRHTQCAVLGEGAMKSRALLITDESDPCPYSRPNARNCLGLTTALIKYGEMNEWIVPQIVPGCV